MKNKLFGYTLVVLMILVFSGFNWVTAKAQIVTPKEVVVTINSIPVGTQSLAVETTLDTNVIKLGSSATSDLNGSLVLVDSMSAGFGVLSTQGNMPPSFTVTIPLEAVSNGISMFLTGRVLDMLGGTEITGAIASVNANSVTVETPAPTSLGTITLIGTNITVVGPGKVAVAFSFSEHPDNVTAKINGSKVDFVSNNVGVAIIDIPASTPVNLNLVVKPDASAEETATIGNIDVSQNTAKGKPPEINSVTVQNKKTKSRLVLTGKRLSKTDTAFAILPTNLEPMPDSTVMGAVLKATIDVADCIPKGSYINLSTLSGTAAKKIKVHGKCNNPLVGP